MNVRILVIVAVVAFAVTLPAVAGISDFHMPNNHQGYEPEQPIGFSHRLHAGTLDIDCQYCHTGADESRHATLPNVSTCMNCHESITPQSERGKQYIETLRQHFAENKPIEWTRVHNLPDYVYFNHSAHVHADVACETCHGPVKEMGVMKQFSDLSMGWCLNCHRTENEARGNERAPVEGCDACHR